MESNLDLRCNLLDVTHGHFDCGIFLSQAALPARLSGLSAEQRKLTEPDRSISDQNTLARRCDSVCPFLADEDFVVRGRQ